MDFWNYWKVVFERMWLGTGKGPICRATGGAVIACAINLVFGLVPAANAWRTLWVALAAAALVFIFEFLWRLASTPVKLAKEQSEALKIIEAANLESQKTLERARDERKLKGRTILAELEAKWRGMQKARMNAAHCVGSRLALTEFFADSFSEPTKVSSLKGQLEVNQVLVFLDEFCDQEAELEMEPAKVFYSPIFPATVAYAQALKHEIENEIAKQPSRFEHIKATYERYSALFPKEIASMNIDSILISEQNGPPGNFGAVTI
jgi:hypothetical protein